MESLKLTCYSGERCRAGGTLAGTALLDLYATAEIAASIRLRGTQGSGLRQHLRSDRSLALSEDLPLLTVAVDAGPRIEAVLEQALAMTGTGLVTLEPVRLLDGDGRLTRLPAAFAIIDELTAQRGLVTSEAVQVVRVPAAGRRDEPG